MKKLFNLVFIFITSPCLADVSAYIVPVSEIVEPNGNTFWGPSVLLQARNLPGYSNGAAQIRGDQYQYCVFVVSAASFDDLDTNPEAFKLGQGSRFSEILSSLDSQDFSSLPGGSRTRYTELLSAIAARSDDLNSLKVADVVRRFVRKIEPANTDDFGFGEKDIARVPQTITENFTSSLGDFDLVSGGTQWEISAGIARPTDNYFRTAVRRGEDTFPNDQYAKNDTGFSTSGDPSSGGILVRSDDGAGGLDGYVLSATGLVNWTLDSYAAGTASYMSDGIVGATITVLRIDAVGTTITPTVNGVGLSGVTNSVTASGKPGMFQYTGEPFATHDNFECTDAVGGGASAPVKAIIRSGTIRSGTLR